MTAAEIELKTCEQKKTNGLTINNAHEETKMEPIEEANLKIIDTDIGYCRYGKGPVNFLFICGGVGCYKKDYPECVLRAFDPNFATIICIDPPGYGTSRPPDRKQEVNRCKMDAKYCLKLMETLKLTPFVVLGWSEGGRTSIHVAGQGKGLVSHMVLLSSGSQVDMRGDLAFKGMRNTDQWMPAAKAPYLEHYSNEFLKEQWAGLCDVVAKVYKDLGGSFPCDRVLNTLKIPVLIVNGNMDRFVLDPSLMSKKLENARIEIHAQGGHDLHIKYPRWFALKVTSFVKESAKSDVKANRK
uniref:Putative alpha/beta hydrolase n=1 Tax=Heterodera glycines TaxID=51029 RepID=Q9BJ53_HETGL|nr:putative alpha/beta hydrolase [Heterodera glycines]